MAHDLSGARNKSKVTVWYMGKKKQEEPESPEDLMRDTVPAMTEAQPLLGWSVVEARKRR